MTVAETILAHLGGNKFLAMTGANHLVSDGNTLRMNLPKNASKANRLYITLDGDDTYTMYFFKFTAGRFNYRTCEFSDDKKVDIKNVSGVYCDMLQSIFTDVTGMYTHF